MATVKAKALVELVVDGTVYLVGSAIEFPAVQSDRAAEMARYGVIELVVDREVTSAASASRRRRSRSSES